MAEFKKIRAPHLKEMKQCGAKIVMLTAYDATMARLLDRAGVDVLLVGDSVGMVVLGHETTVPVTLVIRMSDVKSDLQVPVRPAD